MHDMNDWVTDCVFNVEILLFAIQNFVPLCLCNHVTTDQTFIRSLDIRYRTLYAVEMRPKPSVFAIVDIGLRIVSYLLYHGPMKWTPQQHFHAIGCGQSCGCCRSRVCEIFGACEICEMGYSISSVSRCIRYITHMYAAEHEKLDMHCSCNQCRAEWLSKGWICPDLWHLLEN